MDNLHRVYSAIDLPSAEANQDNPENSGRRQFFRQIGNIVTEISDAAKKASVAYAFVEIIAPGALRAGEGERKSEEEGYKNELTAEDLRGYAAIERLAKKCIALSQRKENPVYKWMNFKFVDGFRCRIVQFRPYEDKGITKYGIYVYKYAFEPDGWNEMLVSPDEKYEMWLGDKGVKCPRTEKEAGIRGINWKRRGKIQRGPAQEFLGYIEILKGSNYKPIKPKKSKSRIME